MSFWGVSVSCHTQASVSVTPLSKDEIKDLAIVKQMQDLEALISKKIEDQHLDQDAKGQFNDAFGVAPGGHFQNNFPKHNSHKLEAEMPEADDWIPETFNEHITEEVTSPRGGRSLSREAMQWLRNLDGVLVGVYNSNPIPDSGQCKVELPDGSMDCYSANLIAENMHA